jgi:hypothetical protein
MSMRIAYFFTIGIATLLAVGCGGTYVDDKRNFERAFQSKRPQNVQVLHSVYYSTPHFTEEHEYYFQMKPAPGSTILKWLTGGPTIVTSTNWLAEVPYYHNLREDRPKWFPSGTLTNYDIWYSTNETFIVLSDKRKADIFVYGSVGM